MSEHNETPSFELWGVRWQLSDARDAIPGYGAEAVAWLTPYAGSERASTVTIRGRARYVGSPRIMSRRDDNGSWVGGWLESGHGELTEANQRELFTAAHELALASFPVLTHADRVAKLARFAEGQGESAARDAWRSLTGDWAKYQSLELTAEDIKLLADKLATGFARRIADGM
jgi:hypothetical protein